MNLHLSTSDTFIPGIHSFVPFPRVLHILILIDHVTEQKPSNAPNTTESSTSTSTNQVQGTHVIGELVSRNHLSSLRMQSSIRYQDLDLDLGQDQRQGQYP